MRRAVLIALVVSVFAPASAFAHAQLKATVPLRGAVLEQQPALVEFDFDESVEGNFGAIRVFDREGRRIDRGDSFHPAGMGRRIATRLKPGAPDGSYTATYRVISADGHVISGGFVFSVGRATAAGQTVEELLADTRPGAATGVAFAVDRAAGYLALAMAAGALLMALWLWPAQGEGVEDRVGRKCRRMLIIAAVLGTVSSVVALVLEAAQGAGVGVFAALEPDTLSAILGTRFGTVWTIAVASWLLVLVAAALITRLRTAVLLALVPMAFLVSAPALSGHAGAGDTLLLLPANVLHVSAMALWLGGLVALLIAVPRGRRPDMAVARFSDIALVAVILLLLTGLLQAVVQIRHFDLVLTTAYGRAVLIKLVLLGVLIGFGAINRLKRVRRGILRLEVVVLVVVLAVSGALAGYPPARAAQSGPYSSSTSIGPDRMDLTVDPAAVGPNALHIYLTDPTSGAPVDKAKEISISATMPAKGIGPLSEPAVKSGPGHYTVSGLLLGLGGHWDLTVTVRVSAFDEYEQRVGLQIR